MVNAVGSKEHIIGVTGGPLYFFRRSSGEVAQRTAEDIAGEKTRLARAQAQSVEQVKRFLFL
ncbi:MAG: hypothetical protein LUH16_04870 [Clostridiales bacterium]|nr:hypothetical protein [Clostridiales bacterium]